MVKFDYEQEDRSTKVIGVHIRCEDIKNTVHFNMKNKYGYYVIKIFIKAVVFQHVRPSWLIKS